MKNGRFISGILLFAAVLFILSAGGAEIVVNRLGEWGTGLYQRVAYNGNYAFAVALGGGIDIIDISDATKPKKIANIETQGESLDVSPSGQYAYVLTSGGLEIFDVSDPYSILPVGSYSLGGYTPKRIDVGGSYAYISKQAYETGSVDILDISNPSAPHLVGSYDPGGRYVWFARVYGNHLFISWSYQDGSDYRAGFRILDVSNPAAPVFVADYYPGDYLGAGDLCLSGNYLYIATGEYFLDIVSLANINSPVRAAKFYTSSNVQGVKTTASNVFIACNQAGLVVANISNPSFPYLVASIPPSNAQFLYKDLFIKENYAFFGAWYAGLQIFDISNPESPQWTSECNDHPNLTTNKYDYGIDLNRVFASGNHAYVADLFSGFKSIDISNPAAPVTKATYAPTNPPTPGSDPGKVRDFDIVGNYAYLPDTYSLQIVDISDPGHFLKIGSIGRTLEFCRVQGNYAYCAGASFLWVFDVSDPAVPKQTGGYSSGGQYFSGLAVSGTCALLTTAPSSILCVLDISNPATPKLAKNMSMPGRTENVCVQGNYAYVAANIYGVFVVDISNPLSPMLVAGCDTPGAAMGLHADGNYLYVADHSSGLQIIDISNPLTPHIVGSYDTNGFAYAVYPSGNTVYLARGLGKMSILGISQGVFHSVTFIPGTGGGIAGKLTQKVLHAGSTTPVTAMPSTGYGFAAWTGTGGFNSGNNPLTINNVVQDMIITAQFATTPWKISGTIKKAGVGLEGVVLNFSNNGGTATTNSNGAYSRAVINGWSGTATPTLAGYTFTPSYRTYENTSGDISGQDYTAAIQPAATITVTSPNGGESWIGGSTHNITWTTTGTVANVKLEYSINKGTNWTTIIASTANTKSYAWTLPSVVSANCLVRVREAATGTPSDVSNAVFAITDAATTYFTQDLYTVPPALQKELHSVFAVDFNHDGFMDLIAPQHDFPPAPEPFNPARILAFRNSGNGSFIESTDQVLGDIRATCPNSYVVADFNGDGWDDVFIVDMGNDREPWGQGKKYILLIQKANGTLVDEASFRLPPVFNGIPYCADEGDIDGDGSLDLVITTTGSPEYQLLFNNGQGYFQYETERLPVAKPNWIPNNCLMLDVNKDGYPDIFMGEEGAHYPQDFIFINDGTGHFSFAPDGTIPPRLLAPGSGTNGAHTADLNGDGWADLVLSCVKSSEERIQVLFNNGSGAFTDVSDRVSGPYLNIRPAGPQSRAIADCNGDGWPDLLAARNVWGGSFVPHLFINHAGAQFEDITSAVWSLHAINGGEPPTSEFADIDSDGDMDVVGIYPGSDQIYVLVNQKPYTIFETPLPYPTAPSLTSPADGATINTNSPTLAWNAVNLALDYDIQVSTNSQFSTTVVNKSHHTTNTYALKNLSYLKNYYWRVRARNTRGAGPWSSVYHFYVFASAFTVVVSPNGGESWAAGSTHAVTWTSSGLAGNITIDLYKGGVFNSNIGTASFSAGTYAWNIPAGLSPATDYKVRIYQGSVEDYSDGNFMITSLTARKDDFVGTWNGQGVFYRNSDTGAWVKLASAATFIACGDLYGDGIDDLIGIWPGQGGVWVKNSANGSWVKLSSTAQHIGAGDMNGDRRIDLLGTWDGQGVYYRNSMNGSWGKLAAPAKLVTAGDLDGDMIDDLIGVWPTQGGVWVKYSLNGAWSKLSSTAADIASGDINGDGRDELLATYNGQGVFYRDSFTGAWVKMAAPADQVTCGDLDSDGKDDLIGIWPGQGGVWVKYSKTGTWAKLSSTATDIASGRMRAGGGALSSGQLASSTTLSGVLSEDPGTFVFGPENIDKFKDFSAEGPGGWKFGYWEDKDQEPYESLEMGIMRIPGPGEPGFRWTEQKKLFPQDQGISDKPNRQAGSWRKGRKNRHK